MKPKKTNAQLTEELSTTKAQLVEAQRRLTAVETLARNQAELMSNVMLGTRVRAQQVQFAFVQIEEIAANGL